MPSKPTAGLTSFVFNLEVLFESSSNAEALEQLLHALNQSGLVDYRVVSGIRLGSKIEERKAGSTDIQEIPVTVKGNESANNKASAAEKILPKSSPPKQPAASYDNLNGLEKIHAIMKANVLIRLIVNKGLGIKLSIPCRIINLNEQENLITVYHVDEKQVYTFRLNEIEDFLL
jgi:hypothetical protein